MHRTRRIARTSTRPANARRRGDRHQVVPLPALAEEYEPDGEVLVAAPVAFNALDIDLTERLATLEALLTDNPACAVAVFDSGRNMIDAGPALTAAGLTADGHSFLKGRALIEWLSVGDVQAMSDAAVEAGQRGSASRSVTMSDGRAAQLHLIEIGDREQSTCAVIIPGSDAAIVANPAPTAIAASPRIGVVRCNAFGAITSASASTLALIGRPDALIDGMSSMDLLHPDDQEMALINWLAAKDQRGVALRWRCRLARADQTPLWVEATIINSIEADGSGHVRLDLSDISREVAATDALIAERELISLVTETLPVGVAKFGVTGCLEHSNQRLTELLAPLDAQTLLDRAVRGDLDDSHLAAAFGALLRDGTSSRLIVDHHGAGGELRHLEWTIRAALDAGGAVTGGVLCIADATEAIQLRGALENRASTDALTGCLNRAGTIAALELALANAKLLDLDPAEGVGLLFIDLDGFKGINDSCGHAVGDSVLELVAARLRAAVRGGDLVGRLGGDEFVVIAPGLTSSVEAAGFASRVSGLLDGPALIGHVAVPIAASVGVAWTSSTTASELLGAADASMYLAKHTRAHAPMLSDIPDNMPIGELANR